MIRTVISLEAENKAWLDRAAKRQRKSMTQLVRHAVQRLRQESEIRRGSLRPQELIPGSSVAVNREAGPRRRGAV
jgi:hypothetical protein